MAEEEAVPEPEEKAEGDSLPFKRGKYPAFVLFFFTYVNTAIVVYSFRALAEDDWFGVFVTDVIYGILGFTLFKKMQDAKTKREMAAYTLGVALGSQTAMWAYKLFVL